MAVINNINNKEFFNTGLTGVSVMTVQDAGLSLPYSSTPSPAIDSSIASQIQEYTQIKTYDDILLQNITPEITDPTILIAPRFASTLQAATTQIQSLGDNNPLLQAMHPILSDIQTNNELLEASRSGLLQG